MNAVIASVTKHVRAQLELSMDCFATLSMTPFKHIAQRKKPELSTLSNTAGSIFRYEHI